MHIQTRIDAVTLARAYVALGRSATSISDLVRACVRRVAASGTEMLEGQTERELTGLKATPDGTRAKTLADAVAAGESHPRLAEATELLAEMDDNFRRAASAESLAALQLAVSEQAAQLPQEETP